MRGSEYEEGISTNLDVFIKGYLDEMLTFEEAALKTPTGRVASSHGFTNVQRTAWDYLSWNHVTQRPDYIYWVELKFVLP